MAAFEQSRAAPFGAIFIHSVVVAVEDVIDAIRARRAAAGAYRDLSVLSDAQLRDIGIEQHMLSTFCENASFFGGLPKRR